MSEFKGTKGKWDLQKKTPYTKVIYSYKSNAEIARVFEEGFINKAQMEANAKLIACAPEIFLDLVDLVWLIDNRATYEELIERIETSKQIIKKATE